MKQNKIGKKLILIAIGYMVCGLGIAICSKGGQGLSAWDALAQTFAWQFAIQLGTMSMILNCLSVAGQILLQKRKFRLVQLLQIPGAILLGSVCNFFLYSILKFDVTSPLMGIFVYVVGLLCTVIGVSIVMNINLITFPIEGLCLAVSEATGKISFSRMRQLVDVFSFVIIVLVTMLCPISWSIGIGTIIGVFCFGPALGVCMKFLAPFTGTDQDETADEKPVSSQSVLESSGK